METDILAHAGKRLDEMSREELIKFASRIWAAHVETFHENARLNRKIEAMKLGLTAEELKRIDWWLVAHPNDTDKGDGGPKYSPWTQFWLTSHGYRTHGDRC